MTEEYKQFSGRGVCKLNRHGLPILDRKSFAKKEHAVVTVKKPELPYFSVAYGRAKMFLSFYFFGPAKMLFMRISQTIKAIST